MQIEELKKQLDQLKNESFEQLSGSQSSAELYEVKVKYWGKSGALTLLLKETGKLLPEDRPRWGQLVNEVKSQLEETYGLSLEKLKKQELDKKMSQEEVDLSWPGPQKSKGHLHLISQITHEIVEILGRLGFSLRLGPLIETDFYNFEALNIPSHHPARDMQDTFFVDDTHVLRTHTSPIQIHSLETEILPLRVMGTGGVFRCDSDISHLPHFHQIEGLCVDENISMSDLKGTIRFFVHQFFGKDLKVRFRPSYFPFTEPSAEVDCQCPLCQGQGCSLCKQTGWIEIGGCGLVNPKVFESVRLDANKWQGFAFGFGIERMAMIRHRVGDIRLFPENDVRFLSQF